MQQLYLNNAYKYKSIRNKKYIYNWVIKFRSDNKKISTLIHTYVDKIKYYSDLRDSVINSLKNKYV